MNIEESGQVEKVLCKGPITCNTILFCLINFFFCAYQEKTNKQTMIDKSHYQRFNNFKIRKEPEVRINRTQNKN